MHSTDGIQRAVEEVGREVARLGQRGSAGEGSEHDALRGAWAALLDALALGPAPEYRKCPHCGGVGMRAATRCGSCWRELVPPQGAEAGLPGLTA